MPTSEDVKAHQALQAQESFERGGRQPDFVANQGLNAEALDVVADDVTPSFEPPAPRHDVTDDSAPPARPGKPQSINDMKRAEIIKSFRQKREDDASEDTDADEIRRLTRDGMPPELAPLDQRTQPPQPQPEPEPEPDLEQQPEPEPDQPQQTAKRKLKVRGQEIELTEDEIIAHAQKALAGDNYLDESRRKLDEANALLRDMQLRALQMAQYGQHQTGQNNLQPDHPIDPPGGEHHADPFAELIEQVQLGSPDEAAPRMRQTVENVAAQKAREVVERERLRDEAARSQRHLKSFQEANPELASDTLAHALMERKLYDLQVEDIRALGIDDAQLPRTPAEIANWHLWYRANGYRVRNIPELLSGARDAVDQFRGVDKSQPAAPRKAEPRVEVTIDRTQRRAAIPQQPSRTAGPRQDVQSQQPVRRDPSEVVKAMAQLRARPRGIVGYS